MMDAERAQRRDSEPADSTPASDRHPIDLVLAALQLEGLVRAQIYRWVRNVADVDELVQELYTRLHTYTGPSPRSLTGFVLTIARNLAFDVLRHRQVEPIELASGLDESETENCATGPEDLIAGTQELELLARAASDLPDVCRQVFTLKKVYGFSQLEISKRLKISENTVEQHLTKAARRLALNLGRRL